MILLPTGSRRLLGILAAGCLLYPGPVGATEESGEPALTVRRTTGFPPASPLTSGTISVVRATTGTEEGLQEATDERQEEDETEIVPYSALPEPVRAAAERQLGGKGDYRAAKYTDQGVPMFQVSAIKEGLAIELVLTEDGEIAFETREMPFSRLPAAVQASLRRQHPEGKFTTIQSVTAHAYTAVYRNEQGEEVELRVEPSGLVDSPEDEEQNAAPAVPDNVE